MNDREKIKRAQKLISARADYVAGTRDREEADGFTMTAIFWNGQHLGLEFALGVLDELLAAPVSGQPETRSPDSLP